MTSSVLIVGAGPAAAGAALALVQNPKFEITDIDIGGRLEAENDAAVVVWPLGIPPSGTGPTWS